MTQPPKQSLSIEMPGVDFAGLAREAIAANLTKALVGADATIVQIVVAAMERKVESNGNPSSYAYSYGVPYVQWLAEDLVRGATKAALQERVDKLRPAIQAQVERQLAKSAKSIAVALTESFIKSATNGYGVNINLTAEFRTRD